MEQTIRIIDNVPLASEVAPVNAPEPLGTDHVPLADRNLVPSSPIDGPGTRPAVPLARDVEVVKV